MARSTAEQLLLGEWACLGILYEGPAHGFAIASRLKPDGDIGRVWSLSRPLTYRSLEQLAVRAYIEPIGEERGIAGGNRTILAATRQGRARLRRWVRTPVDHLRDLRSELLLKLVIAERSGIDVAAMLAAQHERIASIADGLTHQLADGHHDVVALWRNEAADAALRFVDAVQARARSR
jgi:DNA-binding PadR family transcriptional regulator